MGRVGNCKQRAGVFCSSHSLICVRLVLSHRWVVGWTCAWPTSVNTTVKHKAQRRRPLLSSAAAAFVSLQLVPQHQPSPTSSSELVQYRNSSAIFPCSFHVIDNGLYFIVAIHRRHFNSSSASFLHRQQSNANGSLLRYPTPRPRSFIVILSELLRHLDITSPALFREVIIAPGNSSQVPTTLPFDCRRRSTSNPQCSPHPDRTSSGPLPRAPHSSSGRQLRLPSHARLHWLLQYLPRRGHRTLCRQERHLRHAA